jgi:hypothetical protein
MPVPENDRVGSTDTANTDADAVRAATPRNRHRDRDEYGLRAAGTQTASLKEMTQPTESRLTSDVERRHYTRMPFDLPFTLVVTGGSEPLRWRLRDVSQATPTGWRACQIGCGRLSDISQGGCFLTPGFGVKREGRVDMDFVVRPCLICNATGHVVRDDGGDGFAVEFGTVNSDLQKFLDELGSALPVERAEVLSRVRDPELHVSDLAS